MEDNLSEEDKKALRGSKFAPLPPPPPSQPRLAHPRGAIKTNKAAALAKFLGRKLQDPRGLESLDPDLIELAVENVKRTVKSGGSSSSSSRRIITHVDSFYDPKVIHDHSTYVFADLLLIDVTVTDITFGLVRMMMTSVVRDSGSAMESPVVLNDKTFRDGVATNLWFHVFGLSWKTRLGSGILIY